MTTFIELSVILRILTGEKTISSHSCLHLRHLLENLTSPWSTITVPCDTFLMIIKSTFYLVLVSLSTYFQWFSCVLLKVTLCAWLLPFNCCHFDMCLCRILWNAGYPGGGGTSAPCSAGIAWAGRGISEAVAWHAPRVWPLWWCPYFWAKLSIFLYFFGYPGESGICAPCSTYIAWANIGKSKAVAWHVLRVLPLWWFPNFEYPPNDLKR